MFFKKLFNLSIYFFCFLITIISFFGFITDSKKIISYKKNGTTTLAVINNFYDEKKSSYNVKYYIDYSFLANGNTYTTTKYSINSKEKRHTNEVESYWLEKKVGDKFEVLYLTYDPNQNMPLSSLSYKDMVLGSAMMLLVSMLLNTFIKGISINDTVLILYQIIFALFFDLFIFQLILNDIMPIQSAILLIIFISIQSIVIFAKFKLWINRAYTIATVNDHEVVKKTSKYSPNYPALQENRIISRNRKITDKSGRYMNLFTYEYKDKDGGLHIDQRFICLLFGRKYNIGDKIKIVYNTKNPTQHHCLGKI